MRRRVHIISNSPENNSGFSVTATNIGMQLKDFGHDVVITGMDKITSAYTYRDIPIYPIVRDWNEAAHPQLQLEGLIRNMQMHESEVLICIFPPDMKHDMFTRVHPNTIWHMGLDEELVYRNHPTLEAARHVKHVVTMTKGVARQLEKQGIKSTFAYHGHDPAVFHKGFRKDNKEPVMFYAPSNPPEFTIAAGQIPELWEKLGIEFLIGFVGQNNGVRKRIELLMEAFSIFAKDKGQEVHLHLHTLPNYITGIKLLEIAHYFGITDRITFSYGTWRSSGWSEEALNILYNTFDISATASSGGAFELTNFESAVVGIPQVCPDVMPFKELYPDNERGLLAKGRKLFTPSGGFRILVDPEDIASKIQILYDNRHLRDRLGRNCAAWAKEHTWKAAAEKFNILLEK